MLNLKVFVSKLLTIDRLASSAIVFGEVATLAHEARDDSVKDEPLNPNPFYPVQRALKFSAVLGTMFAYSSIMTLPRG